jgi:hypothetical protein
VDIDLDRVAAAVGVGQQVFERDVEAGLLTDLWPRLTEIQATAIRR